MKLQWMNFQRSLEVAKRINYSNNRQINNNCKSLIYSTDVAVAKKNGLPIVALESTIITHGMPYPHNLNTAIRVEDAVRRKVPVLNLT